MFLTPQTPADPSWCWAEYRPDDQRPWDLARAGHLLRRAGFGADWDSLQRALTDGPRRTIDQLLKPAADVAGFDQNFDRLESSAAESNSAAALRAWWLRRMLLSPHPLREKMTLFWHGHFGISNDRVKSASLMYRYVQLLRANALGRFRPLVEALAHDPAMFRGLDADANRKAMPNPNFPRALMDSFLLGQGHYTEEDLREASRAFTGWFVLRGELHEVPREHDPGEKTILGQQGNFGSQDVVRIALEQPATARLIARKVYRWLVSETEEPDDALLAPLVEPLAKEYDVGRLVETILRSNLFFSPAAYRRRVKSPIEFALGILKGLEATAVTTRLAEDMASLGQDLYHPPTLQGWSGGRHWINEFTLLERANLAAALASGGEPYGDKLDPASVAARHGRSAPEAAIRWFLDLYLQGDVPAAVRESLVKDVASAKAGGGDPGWPRRLVRAIASLPEFQLA